MTRSIISVHCLFVALCLTGTFAVAQRGTAQDSCDAVHAACNKTFKTESQMSANNSGVVDVTKAQGQITADGSYRESCKYLRDETLNGEALSVYSDVMKSHLGIPTARYGSQKPGA